jgi:hypothetical protein
MRRIRRAQMELRRLRRPPRSDPRSCRSHRREGRGLRLLASRVGETASFRHHQVLPSSARLSASRDRSRRHHPFLGRASFPPPQREDRPLRFLSEPVSVLTGQPCLLPAGPASIRAMRKSNRRRQAGRSGSYPGGACFAGLCGIDSPRRLQIPRRCCAVARCWIGKKKRFPKPYASQPGSPSSIESQTLSVFLRRTA